ncbi:hypothetical protein C0992_010491 [Termitomyces sp. T32_za158]|nr:hypothetical protein C0992_010491 [Termitomyces sp. T32_za158]
MFPNVLHATLSAFVASAVAVSALSSLSVKVSGEPAVVGIDQLVVKTTVTNTGDEIMTLLNHPESPLNRLPADTFTITNATGGTATFTGIKAKYVPATAIAAGEDAVTVLAPGQSVEVEHDLSEAYAFDKEGEYKIVSNNQFYFVNAQKEAVPIYAMADAHTTTLTGKLSVDRALQLESVAYKGCTSAQRSTLAIAATRAKSSATNAYSYLNSHTSSTRRFKSWFGTYTSSHHTAVRSHFGKISKNNFSSFTFDCGTCTSASVYAYVYPGNFGKMYLCGAFWKAPLSGIIVHEASHYTVNGGTKDYAYGKNAARALAIKYPSRAIFNADSHEYFAENSPAQP